MRVIDPSASRFSQVGMIPRVLPLSGSVSMSGIGTSGAVCGLSHQGSSTADEGCGEQNGRSAVIRAARASVASPNLYTRHVRERATRDHPLTTPHGAV